MEKTLKLLKKYREATNQKMVNISIFEDASGEVLNYDDERLFMFNDINELHKKLIKKEIS